MIRIAGVTIPSEKRIEIALTYVFGIGLTTSRKILKEAGVDASTRANKLSEPEIEKIRAALPLAGNLEGDLRREVTGNIRRLRDISSYVGLRHAKGLPVHGQHTKTNARTRKGRKVTAGSGRKATGQKT